MNLLQKLIDRTSRDDQEDLAAPHLPQDALSRRVVLPVDLGICADGLPVRIDLNDPELQPIALISSQPAEITLLFNQLLNEAVRLYQAEDLQCALLRQSRSYYPQADVAEDSGILVDHTIINPQREWDFLFQAAESAERRFNGQEECHPLVLLIEDLGVLSTASTDFRLTFEWLCLYGAGAGIHTIGALTCDAAQRSGRWLRYFPARILGPMPPEQAERYGLRGSLPQAPRLAKAQSQAYSAGTQYAVYSISRWLYFTPSTNPSDTSESNINPSVLTGDGQ